MSAMGTGLWLIGLGSVVFIGAAVWASPTSVTGRTYLGELTDRRARLGFAGQVAGGAAVAVGSALVAVDEFPSWWVVAASAAAVLLVGWLASSWKVHEYRVS